MTGRPRRAGRLRRTWGQRGVIALNLVMIAASLGAALLLEYGYGRAASINRVALDRSLTEVPEDVAPGERVINVLLVGSDSSVGLDQDDPIQIGRQGERFGDVVIVAHIDERTGQAALLSLPRDLWVEIGDTGREARINRAFVTGGPATLIETIESEFDIPIHHYINVDFAGFQGLVSAVGSVDVYFDRPARDWNENARPEPRSQTGFVVTTPGCHSLDPEMALAYVRSRFYQTMNDEGEWVTDPTSDLGRIRRQQDFIRRVLNRAIDLGARNPFVLSDLIDTGLENVAIDQALTPQLLLDIGTTFRSFEPEQLQTYSFPAEDGQIGRERVLLPRASDAEPLLELFRGTAFDDPDTIGLTVQAADVDPAQDAALDRSLSALQAAGFNPQIGMLPPSVAQTEGLVVRHGPDGRAAADIVAAVLGQPVVYEQVSWLSGRSVILLVGSPIGSDGVESGGADPAGGGPSGPDRAAEPDSGQTPQAPVVASDSAVAPPANPSGCT